MLGDSGPRGTEDSLSSNDTVNMVICYSHLDSRFLAEKAVMRRPFDFLKQKDRGVDVWWDERLRAGDIWDERIKEKIESAHIAVCLVSWNFLTSVYIRNTEARRLRQERIRRGLRIVPVFLSECPWKDEKWLKKTHGLPPDDKYITPDYDGSKRPKIATTIYNHLASIVDEIRASIKPQQPSSPPPRVARPLVQRRQARLVYLTRRTQWNDLGLHESQKLLSDAEERAARIEPNRQIWNRICRAAKALMKTNGGRALTKTQLELLDRRYLLRGTSREPDAFNPRWILRARGLHPQGRDTRNTWR